MVKHNGAFRSSPLLVHFGNGLFRENSPRRWEKRVEIALNGKKVEGKRKYRIRRNGRMRPTKLDSALSEGIWGESRRRKGIGRRDSVEFMVKDWKGRAVVVESDIYCWGKDERLVISDIDGTVTKSDVLGMIFSG